MENSKEFLKFLRNLLLIEKGHALLCCGSSVELPIQYVLANATDLDIMYIPTDICALPVNVSAPQAFQGKTLVVNTEDTHPGFARLCSPGCKGLYRRQVSIIIEDHYQNGPAWTKKIYRSENQIGFINFICGNLGSSEYQGINTRLLEMKMDRVFAIYCPCWPTKADEWKTRERPNGWPPAEMINKIVASGCYFVAKPHHSSPNDDTQWRFSFSHAEVILIHSWTDVQKYIYHILRLIKSEVVKACGGSDETVLCTYFFKTLMLWECERKPKEFWEDENIEKSVSELLCIMIGWLIDGCCPNYFIPNSNMISDATESVDFSKEIKLFLIYATAGIHVGQITTIWPKAYRTHMLGRMQFVLPEKVLLHVNLMQVRDNYLNPVYPKSKTNLLKQLTERDSLLWLKTSDLYTGIVSHLQFMKTCCPKRKVYLKRLALWHFISALVENEDECSNRFLSIGESIYEFLGRISSATTCNVKSRRMPKDICELHFNGNCQQSPLSTTVKYNLSTHSQFVRCYSRREESEKGDKEGNISSSATSDHLTTCIKTMVQTLFTNTANFVTTPTRVISLAYLANFYYTALQDRNKASALCDTVIDYPEGNPKGGKTDLTSSERAFPIFMTNKLSTIFDEHFRTVLGLITLHRYIGNSLQDYSTVLVRICPAQFLKYLKIQCWRWEGVDEPVVNENFKCSHSFHECYDTHELLSEVFMAAVLRASRFKT